MGSENKTCKNCSHVYQAYKDIRVKKELQEKRIIECEETINQLIEDIEDKDSEIRRLELALQSKNQELFKVTEQFQEQNNRANQQNETIADLREFVANRIGVDALDSFDERIRDIDQLLEQAIDEDEDDDVTTDGRSDPVIPFQNQYFSIDENNDAHYHCHPPPEPPGSIEYQENIPPSPLHYPPESTLHYHSSSSSSPAQYEQPYVEAVRKKDERKKLIGTTCKCCADYYYAAGNLPGPEGRMITPEERIQQCSRHRDRFKRPKTPPGFWKLDFISTQDIERQYQQKDRMDV
ncbi:hypothetical protein BDA99DRAFT_502041 [Phascolomyces articulosus]|uniref:DNA endonuclease activator Ctp1 C-terminal domain-containing protein n=1 Tax=Phascolomyces articulosus TaxID=60185 RepID=A0AAD5K5K0_9FUNG|nr:hypothetical protein BDA99DRAFT_502041 [Phascolomyces articulosus]